MNLNPRAFFSLLMGDVNATLVTVGRLLPVHELFVRAWRSSRLDDGDQTTLDIVADHARQILIAHAMRFITARDRTTYGRAPPSRAAADAERVWLVTRSAQLDLLLRTAAWHGQRWQSLPANLPASRSAIAMRFAPGFVVRGFGVSHDPIERF